MLHPSRTLFHSPRHGLRSAGRCYQRPHHYCQAAMRVQDFIARECPIPGIDGRQRERSRESTIESILLYFPDVISPGCQAIVPISLPVLDQVIADGGQVRLHPVSSCSVVKFVVRPCRAHWARVMYTPTFNAVTLYYFHISISIRSQNPSVKCCVRSVQVLVTETAPSPQRRPTEGVTGDAHLRGLTFKAIKGCPQKRLVRCTVPSAGSPESRGQGRPGASGCAASCAHPGELVLRQVMQMTAVML